MKNGRGFTLIEVIISIAILGILTIPILSIFNTGLTNIVSAGDRTAEVFSVQGEMDSILNTKVVPTTPNITVDENVEIVINLKISGITNKIVSGKLISVRNIGENNIDITTFIPD